MLLRSMCMLCSSQKAILLNTHSAVKSSRTKAIKTKKETKAGIFSVYLFKIGPIRCHTQVSTCFHLLHAVKKSSAEILFSWLVTAF